MYIYIGTDYIQVYATEYNNVREHIDHRLRLTQNTVD